MNEPVTPRWTDPAGLPPPTIYDPAEDASPPFGGAPPPPVVLLLVGEVEPQWAVDTAIALCDAWAADAHRVVLADLHFENPLLQGDLGGEGMEGVVDVFLYGASLSRSLRSVEGHNFQFMPPGTYTPDIEAIARHRRWAKLVGDFRESGGTFVLFAPASAVDAGSLASWVDEVLLLGNPHDTLSLNPLAVAGIGARGLIVPPRGESVAPSAVSVPVRSHREVLNDDRRDAGDDALHLPPPPVRAPHRGQRAAVWLLWALLGLALLAAVGYAVVSVRPEIAPWASVPSAQTDPEVAAVVSADAPRPLGEPLPFSVQVTAFQNFEAARDRLFELREMAPTVLFFVSPEEMRGVVYYRIFAGALPDIDVARQTKGQLVEQGAVGAEEAEGEWTLIHEARFSFALGDEPSRADATAAVDSLLAREIPAYAVAVPYSNGDLRWHLYAGAFADSAGASTLQQQLATAGLTPSLTVRFGSPASPEL